MSIPDGWINYCENRQDSRIIPLRSYGILPLKEKFAGLEFFDFQLKDISFSLSDFVK